MYQSTRNFIFILFYIKQSNQLLHPGSIGDTEVQRLCVFNISSQSLSPPTQPAFFHLCHITTARRIQQNHTYNCCAHAIIVNPLTPETWESTLTPSPYLSRINLSPKILPIFIPISCPLSLSPLPPPCSVPCLTYCWSLHIGPPAPPLSSPFTLQQE